MSHDTKVLDYERSVHFPPLPESQFAKKCQTMKAVKLSLLLLSNHLSVCSSSSFIRRNCASIRAFKPPHSSCDRREKINGASQSQHQQKNVLKIRGGQQSSDSNGSAVGGSTTGSYHGNYVSSSNNGEPKAAVAQPAAASATTVQQTLSTPPVLASATSTNSKLSNLQERTGPAVLMLSAVYLLLKFTGTNGLIGLVFAMQIGMYSESTNIVEEHVRKSFGGSEIKDVTSIGLQKWWWFVTAMMFTSGRYVNLVVLLCGVYFICISIHQKLIDVL